MLENIYTESKLQVDEGEKLKCSSFHINFEVSTLSHPAATQTLRERECHHH